MQTSFSLAQLADPSTAEADKILRACVHCGFCTATCPTFVLLGDELDSPRGRIYLVKEMLEKDRPADAETVLHIDRCLSCLACMTTCPSGVNYMHLVDMARARIETTYRRPWPDRLLRMLLRKVLPDPNHFGLAVRGAALARPLAPLLARLGTTGARLAAMLRLVPDHVGPRSTFPPTGIIPHQGRRVARVALLQGCAQRILRPQINDAAIRLLSRLGVEVVLVGGETCCGALTHHLGAEADALASARHNIDLWSAEIDRGGLDAIVVTASGCGTMIKDYGFLLRCEPAYASKAAQVSALAKDVIEVIGRLDLPSPCDVRNLAVAYQSPCSMQHGQKLDALPKRLLAEAGYRLREIIEGHLCCGSAGTYNILQPDLAERLRDRKIGNIRNAAPDLVATGNIGCLTQLADGLDYPVLHTVELLDYAYGGPMPVELERRAHRLFSPPSVGSAPERPRDRSPRPRQSEASRRRPCDRGFHPEPHAEGGPVLEVLLAFLRLGVTSFGGPIAHLGYFRAELVQRRKWLDEAAYADIVALCQFLPGPASSQAGMILGMLRAGLPGALAAWLGFTLPSALALVLFAYGVGRLGDLSRVAWLHGLEIVAVAVIAQAVWGMARTLCPDRERATLAVGTALLTLAVPSAAGQIGAILAGGIIGWSFLAGTSTASATPLALHISRRTAILCLILFGGLLVTLPLVAAATSNHTMAVISSFYRSGALVFGGGHVVLPLLQQAVVPQGWVSDDMFLAGYGAAQAVPGPLFTFAAYLGAVMATPPNGWIGGLACLGAIFLPSFLVVVGVLPFWDVLRRQTAVQSALKGINAAVVGILLGALYTPVWTSAIFTPADFGLGLVAFLLLVFWQVPPWLVVIGGAIGASALALIA